MYAATYDFERHGDIEIIDISDPSAPTLATLYELPDEGYGITVENGLIYVADMQAGLLVYDISNPTYPVQLGRYNTPSIAYDVSLAGGNVLVADMSSLMILKFTRPDDINETGDLLPSDFALMQNYPNPFNAATTIKYNLPFASEVKLDIFDISGRKVRELVNEYQEAGFHQIKWDAENAPSGIYFYRLKAGEKTSSSKMLLIK